MSEENPKINVYQTKTFQKILNRLDDKTRDQVDDEIELIIDDPEIGDQKKGDLAHIRVHKFRVHDEQVLLGYNWNEGSLTLTLMSLGPHENFYRKLKQRRQADLKLLKD